MVIWRNISNARSFQEGGFLVTVEVNEGQGWEEIEYVARANGGGISDEILDAIDDDDFSGEITEYVVPEPESVTSTPLTQAQWHYGLRRFGLLANIKSFVDALEPNDAAAAYQFEARSLHANSFRFADVLTLLAAYSETLPEELQITEQELAGMWTTVLVEMADL